MIEITQISTQHTQTAINVEDKSEESITVRKTDIIKWVTSVLAMMTPPEQQAKLNTVIKQASENPLQIQYHHFHGWPCAYPNGKFP